LNTITDYLFYPSLVLRAPCLSYSDYHNQKIEDLLKNNYFLSAIRVASPTVFELLEKAAFDMDKLPVRMQHTLQKYFNRMCFRPTPFGLFSTFSAVRWSDEGPLIFDEKVKAHIQPDYKCLQQLIKHDTRSFQANPSLYKMNNGYRYLYVTKDVNDDKCSYGIHYIKSSPYLSDVLKLAEHPGTIVKLNNHIARKYRASEADSRAFIEQLCAMQVLVPVPNGRRLPALINATHRQPVIDPCKANQMISDLGAGDKYINTERKVDHGGLKPLLQTEMLNALEKISRLIPAVPEADLIEFAGRFTKKFERKTIPLLIALDPELGVGYAGLGSMISKSILIPAAEKASKQETKVNWTATHVMLLKKWHELAHGEVLQLTDQEIGEITVAGDALLYPPTTSVILRTIADQIYIEQIGGAAGTSLIGRFTTLSEDIDKIAAEMAAFEVTSNPDVIFAEINHLSDLRIANIERRNSFYPYEIPVLTDAKLPRKCLIELSDLMVRVVDKHIILTSKKHGSKRIVPRLSSAYNYSRSDLAVFRFLCDLQYQGLQLLPKFHLNRFFPDMDHYPRVAYKNTILQLAGWMLRKEELQQIEQGKTTLQTLITAKGFPKYISMDEGDNQLVFDTTNDRDLALLEHCLAKKAAVLISEFPFAHQTPVRNKQGDGYVNQFVALLYHQNKIYRPLRPVTPVPEIIPRNFLPGSEWTAFKIYLHPANANDVLLNHISPMIRFLEDAGFLKKWFFIRYADPDYHLRLRIQSDATNAWKIVETIAKHLTGLATTGSITQLQLVNYERELERYGADTIELTETLFHVSSDLVSIETLTAPTTESQLDHFKFCFDSIHSILNAFEITVAERIVIFDELYRSFNLEYNYKSEDIRAKFREIKGSGSLETIFNIGPAFENRSFHREHALAGRVLRQTGVDIPYFLSDLIHMHLNRFLVSEARRQEMMIYYCLFKGYQSAQARVKTLLAAEHS
jgi:thiopeptide-type bacteriocin biosynthesis protein